MNDLRGTIPLMDNADYKERFKAEFYQVDIRLKKLITMVEKWERGTLEFTPTCPIETYRFQIRAMEDYRAILVVRAKIEGIDV